MEFFSLFTSNFVHYFKELWLTLLLGFFLSGIFYQFFPTEKVQQYLGQKGFKSIFFASIIGAFLPVCCIGTLPIALTLRRKQASLGAVMAFLVATPATSITALFVCWKLLGLAFTILTFFGAILMGIVVGIICDGINSKPETDVHEKSCCHEKEEPIGKTTQEKFQRSLVYAFITLPKKIGVEIIFGMALSSFILSFQPIQQFIKGYLSGLIGYAVIIIFGLVTYVCSTGDVPIAHALVKAGMSQGHALCYLLVGPVTSYSTILVIHKEFGKHVLVVYLFSIVSISFLFGILTDLYLHQVI